MQIEGTIQHRNRMGTQMFLRVRTEQGEEPLLSFKEDKVSNYSKLRYLNLGDRIQVEGEPNIYVRLGGYFRVRSFTILNEVPQ